MGHTPSPGGDFQKVSYFYPDRFEEMIQFDHIVCLIFLGWNGLKPPGADPYVKSQHLEFTFQPYRSRIPTWKASWCQGGPVVDANICI